MIQRIRTAMRRVGRGAALGAGILIGVSLCAYAVRWSPAELDLAQEPGTEATYSLTLVNDGAETAELRVYAWDWIRSPEGQNDLGIPPNGIRWTFDRPFVAGETVTVRYAVQLPQSGAVGVEGTYQTWAPQVISTISGAATVSSRGVPTAGGLMAAPALITRSVESVDGGGTVTVALTIRPTADFQGLTVYEAYAERVDLSCVECGGGQFDTVNRSCSAWITLSRDRVVLEPGQSEEIRMIVRTPQIYSGTHWSIIQAESRAVSLGEIGGTQIIARPTVGLKIFVTAPRTEVLLGAVTDVQEVGADPLVLQATFENLGNVQLVVTCQVQVVDRTGTVVRVLRFEEAGRDYFRILPGSARTLTMIDTSGVAPLAAGIYQASVVFDFGGENPVLGVRAFRVR